MASNSNNVICAENQQERLIKVGWIIGFVDGEGCFSVGFIKQANKIEKNRLRRGYKIGYQVTCEFAVTQGKKSLGSLKELRNFFRVGRIYINRRKDNHKEPLYRFVVRNRKELTEVIVPFFQKFTLKTSKRKDFTKFVECLEMVKNNEHLQINGFIKIAKITMTMNRRKNRSALIRILRDHTLTSKSVEILDEEMVRTA